MTPALAVRNLRKRFRGVDAVRGISFTVPKGKIIGLLGPNGAGKTTTISMLLGLVEPDEGSIQYFGQTFSDHREACLARINTTSAFNELLGRISVYENLIVFAQLYDVPAAAEKIATLASRFSLTPLMKQRYWDLSAGQRTRVNIVKALLNDPELLLMDEPTASLDPDVADTVMSFIEELREERAISILYTSHNMAEISRICDEVIFLDRGEIVAHDTPLGLTKRITSATLTLTFDAAQAKVRAYLKSQGVRFEFVRRNIVSMNVAETSVPKLIFGLSEAGVWLTDIDIAKPTLEHVFLTIARRDRSGAKAAVL